MGVSRDTFYHCQELVEEGGIEALINKSRRIPNINNRVDEATEEAVVTYAVEQPAHGQHRANNGLRKKGVFVLCKKVSTIVFCRMTCHKSIG
jgi:winged helix-turn helix protein